MARSETRNTETTKKRSFTRLLIGLWLVGLTVFLIIVYTNMQDRPIHAPVTPGPVVQKIRLNGNGLPENVASRESVDRLEKRVVRVEKKVDEVGDMTRQVVASVQEKDQRLAILNDRVGRLEAGVGPEGIGPAMVSPVGPGNGPGKGPGNGPGKGPRPDIVATARPGNQPGAQPAAPAGGRGVDPATALGAAPLDNAGQAPAVATRPPGGGLDPLPGMDSIADATPAPAGTPLPAARPAASGARPDADIVARANASADMGADTGSDMGTDASRTGTGGSRTGTGDSRTGTDGSRTGTDGSRTPTGDSRTAGTWDKTEAERAETAADRQRVRALIRQREARVLRQLAQADSLAPRALAPATPPGGTWAAAPGGTWTSAPGATRAAAPGGTWAAAPGADLAMAETPRGRDMLAAGKGVILAPETGYGLSPQASHPAGGSSLHNMSQRFGHKVYLMEKPPSPRERTAPGMTMFPNQNLKIKPID